ncbi:MAG: class II glutamine amidotransferase [Elusimicrobia bacterium]|nr:class II glutamine amidotransferase [Elusimicrobiota bacterium]
MCRIFAQIAVDERDPSDYIVHSSCSLLAQSKAKKDFLQEDGWGIAALNGRGFKIFKSPNPIYREAELLKKAARGGKSRIVIAHIRAASNPLKLPKRQLIAKEHNQPFGASNLTFAHNGTINIAAAARERLLGPYRKNLKGKNDSEIYFWILYKWYRKTGDVARAFEKTAQELWQLWRELPKSRRKGWKYPYTGLNAAVSDGRRLWALCHSLMPAQSKSLCLKDQPYNRLALKLSEGGRRLVIGSEKLGQEPGWTVVPMHSLTVAEESNGLILYQTRRFPWRRI